jgi:transposase
VIGKLSTTDIYAYCEPVDMRKGFEGLAGLVRNEMELDPLSGALFIFTNRRCTHAKILLFDGTGMCIYAKRLERGRFAKLWRWSSQRRLVLKPSELQLFLEGSDLVGRFRVSPDPIDEKDLAPRS